MATTRKFRPRIVKAEVVGRAEVIGTRPAAREAHIPVSTVHHWRNSPDMAQLRTETREDVAADVWAAFQKGVRRMTVLMDTTEDLTKVAIASGILYDKMALMTGGPTSRTETRSVTDDLNDDEKRRLRDWVDSLPSLGVPTGTPG